MTWIHFISGLPRSGSTLLAALLRRNPRCRAGVSGPLAGLLSEMSARKPFSAFIDNAKRQRRGWCQWMPAIAQLFPDAKVIACVRDLPGVLESIERLIQRNVFSLSSIFNYTAGGTVYSRANGVAAQNGMVGAPFDALKQACFGSQRDRLLLVQYETLTADPAKTLHALYNFLGEPFFAHDFEHIDYDVTEFDERAGTPGLHTVGSTVKSQPRETLLPPDLFKRFVHDAFWRDPRRIPDGLRVV